MIQIDRHSEINTELFATSAESSIMKVLCKSLCQLLIDHQNSWRQLAVGEIVLLGRNGEAYLCFLHNSYSRTIKIQNGLEWSSPHRNLLMLRDYNNDLIAFNFPVQSVDKCLQIVKLLAEESNATGAEGTNATLKNLTVVRSKVNGLVQNNFQKLWSCLGSDGKPLIQKDDIGIPLHFRHQASVRYEDGSLKGHCASNVDKSTMEILRVVGISTKKTFDI